MNSFHFIRYRKQFKKVSLLLFALALFIQMPLAVFAQQTTEDTVLDYNEQMELRKQLPIQTNEIENWPTGPAIGAEAAILMEANTGTILYEKNIHEELYPASTTKMMSCLLAVENCSLDEMVSFSKEAVFGIERGSSNAGIDVGEQIELEECLYIILLYSANEVTAAVGEHVAGSIDGFVDMMNEKAKELGCQNTHFNNTNGLPDENHYTSAYDLALIAKEFYKNETLCKIASTSFYTVYPTPTQPDQWDMQNHHKLCKHLTYEYDGFIGGKTGFTSVARQTLVSGAERNGMRLICVILMEESPYQFTDTVTLFDYGFNNFSRFNVAENDTKYTIGNTDFFHTNSDIFGSSKQIISLNRDDYIILPITADFSDTTSELLYDETAGDEIATIVYSYGGVKVGPAGIELASDIGDEYDFDGPTIDGSDTEVQKQQQTKVIFINVIKVLGAILVCAVLLVSAFYARSVISGYHFGNRSSRRRMQKSGMKIKNNRKRYIIRPSRKRHRRKDRDLHF
ncbi:MAG: D-alanyl-D-alanine carboxypeptidase [Lachnospiraceae bacterium]|nr:D-alanyl-D-alanine carboxypeptidase [Lachnospiraceae bacterium]